jgi:hypothetical protein
MRKKLPEREINPKTRIYLFSEENPTGEIFSFAGGKESEEYKAMLENGYFDTPANLKLPEKDLGLTTEQVQRMRPEDLKAMLESYGFIVMTPEQLKAEVNKLIDTVIDIKEFTDETIFNEAERRNSGFIDNQEIEELDGTELIINTTAIDDDEDLKVKFLTDPKSLTREEHIILGKELGVKLRINFGEDTMISKINDALNAE